MTTIITIITDITAAPICPPSKVITATKDAVVILLMASEDDVVSIVTGMIPGLSGRIVWNDEDDVDDDNAKPSFDEVET